MFDTDKNGFITPTGDLAGGHAILINQIRIAWKGKQRGADIDLLDLDKSYIGFHNSWGTSWGVNGTARMTLANFDRLRREDGECSFAVDTMPKG